jgi:hypothetical protein
MGLPPVVSTSIMAYMTRENSYLAEKIPDNSETAAVIKSIYWTVEYPVSVFTPVLIVFIPFLSY